MILRKDNNDDLRRYNDPNVNEVAIIFRNQDGQPPANRDIVTWPKNRNEVTIPLRSQYKSQRINTQMSVCDPMTYPLLFPLGDHGWQ